MREPTITEMLGSVFLNKGPFRRIIKYSLQRKYQLGTM